MGLARALGLRLRLGQKEQVLVFAALCPGIDLVVAVLVELEVLTGICGINKSQITETRRHSTSAETFHFEVRCDSVTCPPQRLVPVVPVLNLVFDVPNRHFQAQDREEEEEEEDGAALHSPELRTALRHV